MNEELPEGWHTVTLEQVLVDSQNGCSARSGTATPTVVLRLADVSIDGTVAADGLRKIPLSESDRAKYALAPGDLLAFRVNGSPSITGQVIQYPGPSGHTYCDHFIRLRVQRAALEPRFAAWVFKTSLVRREVERQMVSSAGQNTVSQATLKALEIPLAPLAEQRRIVAQVEALLEQVNRAKGRLDRVPLILKRFRQAVLEAACSGRLTGSAAEEGELPSGWRDVALEELTDPGGIFDGARDHGAQTAVAQNLRTVDYTESGVRVIRLENLAHLRFVEEKRTFISEAKYAGLVQNTIREGDILFGSFIEDEVRVCLFPRLGVPAITKADCFCVRARAEAVNVEYLAYQLATRRTHDSLLEEVHGATRPRITTKQLKKITVPLCPPAEQQAIVAILRQHFALADAIERRVQAATARADKLPQAILSKAFSGELVPTEAELARAEGRTYETAEELLKRVTGAAHVEEPTKRQASAARRSIR